MKKLALALGLTATMSMALVGCGSSGPEYVDGNYEGKAQGAMSEISLSVDVQDGKIAGINILDHDETEGISDPAFDQVPDAIVEKNSTDVDTVSGATGTSEGIMNAVDTALEGATE